MNPSQVQPSKANRSKKTALLLSLICFALSFLAVGITTYMLYRESEIARNLQLAGQYEHVSAKISRRLNIPDLALEAISAHIQSQENTSRESFYKFVDDLEIHAHTRGLKAIGFLELNQPGDLTQASVKFVDPLDYNSADLKENFHSDPIKVEAMNRSVAEAHPSLTSSFTVDENQSEIRVFMLFSPVYHPAKPLLSEADRKQALRGFVYAKLSIDDLLAEIASPKTNQIKFSLVEERSNEKERFVFSNRGSNDSVRVGDISPSEHGIYFERFTVNGQTFLLNIENINLGTRANLTRWLPATILGICFSVGVGLIVWLLSMRRIEAETTALDMTQDLVLMAKVAKHTASSIIILDSTLTIQWVNQSFERDLEFSLHEVQGLKPESFLITETTDRLALNQLIEAAYTNNTHRCQLQLQTKNKKTMWFDIELQPIRDDKVGAISYMLIGNDITALRKAQSDAIAQRGRWETIARASHAGVVFWNLITGKFGCNSAFAEMLGHQKSEWLSMTIDEFQLRVHEQDRQLANRELAKLISVDGPEQVNAVVRFKHKDGQWIWTEAQAQVQERLPDGMPASLLLVYLDTTKTKAREEEWRARADLSADWFWRTDAEHKFVEISSGYCKAMGINPNSIEGKRRDEITGLEPPLGGWERFHEQLDLHEPIECLKYCTLVKDKKPKWVEINGTPIWSHTGDFQGYTGIGRDVTAAQSATEDLLQSLSLVDALFEALPLPVVMKDVDGKYVRSNAAYGQLLGKTQAELFNADINAFAPEALAAKHTAEDQLVLQERMPREYEVEQILASGFPMNTLIRKAPILDNQAEPIGIVGMVIDVTPQRAAEKAERIAKESAQLANAAKSAFLATMSHEIRTPMNGVLGMAELLSHSGLNGKQSDAVKTIRDSAGNLLQIIDDILDFSKIEAGHLELDSQPVRLLELAEGVVDALQQVAFQKKVQLNVYVDPSIAAQVLGDELRLRQVLNNLVGNAIKFSSEQLDRAGMVCLRIESNGQKRIDVSVADNGIGISETSKQHLFEAFNQAEKTTARRFGGTGLGLVISQRLVNAMGSRITIDSEVGVGSKFSFTLGLAPFAKGDSHDLSLTGTTCWLSHLNESQALDWSAYLRSAGALVFINTQPGYDLEEKGSRHVVIRNETADDSDLRKQAEAWRAPNENWSMVFIGNGNRRQPRLLKNGVVHLDLIRRNSLIGSVCLANGTTTYHNENSRAPTKTTTDIAPSIAEAELEQRLILVAEDDPINRKVIEQQLALIGYACEAAEDGVIALEKWRSGRFSLLLTDLHMPILDGYDLTRTIRAFESEFSKIPILALTANALIGEDAKAKEAGVDAYLTKPITLEKLKTELQYWLPTEQIADNVPMKTITSIPSHLSVFDSGVLRVYVGDDQETIDELLADYLLSAEQTRLQITTALRNGENIDATAAAHRLKSSSRAVGTLDLGQWCSELERMPTEEITRQHIELISVLNDKASAAIAAIKNQLGLSLAA